MALLGLAVSVYLTVVHFSSTPLACVQTGVVNCDLVTRSSYGLVPGTAIPVSAAGIVWFGGSLLLVLVQARDQEALRLAVVYAVWCLLGLAVVLYLVYAELRLGHICEWCSVVHALVVLSLLIAVARLSPAGDQSRNY